MAVRKRRLAGPIRPGESQESFKRRVAEAARAGRNNKNLETINSDPTLGQILPAVKAKKMSQPQCGTRLSDIFLITSQKKYQVLVKQLPTQKNLDGIQA